MTDELAKIIEEALSKLDLAARVQLLAGQDMWSLPELPEIGLPALVMSDGPIGVRGRAWGPKDPSVALPSPTALAASWDPELARKAGLMLGQEARRKGVHVLLAPTINLHRSPRGGRHFECYSEDPLLTGVMAVGFLTGVQEQGVAATAKHFVANDSETERMTVNVQVSERVLRELYLLPFEMAVQAGVWLVMAAYNSVNGTTMSEHDRLINGLLKAEWGFDGVVVSDWLGTRSTAPAALGGLDIAMPATLNPWTEGQLLEAVQAGLVPEKVIEEKARRVLRLAARVGLLGGQRPQSAVELDGAQVAHEVAVRSFVLARNEGGLLPLRGNELGSVAVLGIAADETRAMGGGSAEVVPKRVVSLLEGLQERLGQKISYAIGVDARATLPKAGGASWSALKVTCHDRDGAQVFTEPLVSASVRWIGDIPAPDIAVVTIEGLFRPQSAGEHTFSVRGTGPFRLEVNGEQVWTGTIWPDMSDPASFLFPPEERVGVTLGTSPVTVRLVHDTIEGLPIPATSFQLGHMEPRPGDDELLEAAVAAAAQADVAIVVVGTTEHVESEGFDRPNLTLPGRQNELVERVLQVNPRTVVVVNSGSPVLLPWADSVPAVLLGWFPGQEGGAALASVLLGEQEPGGRLPTTWPRHGDQALPVEPVNGILRYSEELAIGYRAGFEALFPFGHGLGYTSWEYSNLAVSGRQVTVTLRNTGNRVGREVVQVYLSRKGQRWLGGFASVSLEPGEAADVAVQLPKRSFQRWSDEGWQTIEGDYGVHIGRSVTEVRLDGVVSITP
ncbi:beta-glucosidase [Rhizocola hellebori]|uniref:Beta-glucosidase n=1 Tax=Rhizocola hellebori TaxID=1392758 RepID=A0A8J3VFN0_9ACTN|nr:glycoside hydrolase family 3 protein [Rhizocola hellebori]GIH04675.1 beta-glucosidase [Rhizocola hellebori]